MTAGRAIVPGLVSVIVPVFNRQEMLVEAVACVEAQTYRPVEVIVVDDGSTDGTGDLCDRLAVEKHWLVRVLHRQNGGPGAARETGRLAARGEFLQYLDSDDWLDPRKLEKQVAALGQNPDAGMAYCVTRERLPDGSSTGRPSMRTGVRLDSIFPEFLSGRCWQTVTPLWRRTTADRIGPWSDLRVEEDMEYDARAGAEGFRPVWCAECLAEHRHHSGPRASGGAALDRVKLRSRADAHERIYNHALRAGVGPDDPHMKRYARELFLLSRQCGAAGLAGESRELFRLAREASGPERAQGLDFVLYRVTTLVAGWKAAGVIACASDRLRGTRPGGSE